MKRAREQNLASYLIFTNVSTVKSLLSGIWPIDNYVRQKFLDMYTFSDHADTCNSIDPVSAFFTHKNFKL